ncbi:MAG: (Fe-S)-binding protein [Syntrophaceae bacterium]|nr:(Fe-S)-binding protein [Syntrophaceae bacterium]
MNQRKVARDLHSIDEEEYIEDLKGIILDAAKRCRNCNYCFTICPLFHSTRGFMSQTPSGIMQSINYALKWDVFKGEDQEILRDLLYLCTTCNGCVLRCKSKATGLPVLDAIEAGRKLLREMMIGPLPQQRKPLKDIYLYGNPYGEKPERRVDWTKGLKVKIIPPERAEVLFYVGCTTAYEPSLHLIGKSLVRLLQSLHVDFGILNEEVCCGEPARRMGDEGLFQEMMNRNLDQFKSYGIKTIVSISPHCFNTFLNEYPTIQEEIKIQHYTEFLAEAFKGKKPLFKKEISSVITYHDPCYLGKHNQIFNAPRELLQMIPGVKLVEMKMTREESLCCGGGGGRMFAEVEEERRLSDMRITQALEAGANIIATACPWCYKMLQNSIQDSNLEDKIRAKDISIILSEALN